MDLQGTESLVAQCVALRIRIELVAMDSLQFRMLATGRPLSAATFATTIAAAVMGRANTTRFWLLIATAACFLAGGLTRFLNQPINAIMVTWHSDAPPANWTVLRDAWWRWHLVRLAFGIGGYPCSLLPP